MLIPPNQIRISLINAPEFNLEYLWWLTILFFVLAVIYFIGVFVIRNKISSKNKRTKNKKVEFSPMINEFLFYDDSNTKEEKMNYLNLKIQIRELIKNDFDRKVLTEVLLDLRKDLSGNSQKVLIDLYKDLGLHHDAFQKLGSFRWQVVSRGIQQLTTMEVEDAYGLVIKFINHRQSTIRKQAEIAVVNLKEEGIKYFLDNTRYKIAEWQQLKLLDVLRHKPNYTPPQFGLWLTSDNTHVVLFALRLIKYFKQNDAEQSIITLLKHKKRDIQAEAIQCIIDFHFTNAILTLKLVYKKASHDIKLSILDAIGELGTIAEVPFLENLQLTERKFHIKNKVISTLNKIDPERILPTKNIETSEFYNVYFDENDQALVNEFAEDDEETYVENTTDEIATEVEMDSETLEEIDEPITTVDHLNTDNQTEIINEDVLVDEALTAETDFINVALDDALPKKETNVISSTAGLDLSFLPHIENEKTMEEVVENSLDDNNSKAEISSEDDVEQSVEDEEFSFHFLPVVVDEISTKNEIPTFEEDDFEPLFLLNETAVLDEGKENEMENSNEDSKSTIAEIDWSSVNNAANDDNEIVVTDANAIEEMISFKNNHISFSPNFISQKELDAMVLLENIHEMGDSRELELLHDIIEENSSEIVTERANQIIQKFSYQSLRPSELFSEEKGFGDSVFTDIYHRADYETKLMLLDEIMNVGTTKEIQLLENIIESESNELVDKATEVLSFIKSNSNNKLPETFLEQDSIFSVDFELDLNEAAKQNSLDSNENGSTLFDQLCNMSNSLYNKLNG